MTLANLPVNLIDRVEIYKGVVPASLGTDALGGAVNIITQAEKKNFMDASYSIGSFHTHRADLNAQFVERHTGLVVRPTVGINYSKNDYRMKDVQMRNETGDQFIYGNPKRFHDGYFSLLAQIEAGITGKFWADEFLSPLPTPKRTRSCRPAPYRPKSMVWLNVIRMHGTYRHVITNIIS